MIENFNLDKRVQLDVNINDSEWMDGLIDITQFLFTELKTLLRDENRFFGIVPTYFKELQTSYNSFNEAYINESDIDRLGRILYLIKPVIISEYRKLCQRKLSKADSVITIYKKIIDLLININEENSDYNHLKEIKNINKIITKLFNNIRNNGKNSSLINLTDSIKKYMKDGLIGRMSLHELSFKESEQKKEKIKLDPNLGNTRITKDFNNKIKEISWTEK